MNKLRNDLHISASKIELNIHKNCEINIEGQLDRLISIKFADSEKFQTVPKDKLKVEID